MVKQGVKNLTLNPTRKIGSGVQSSQSLPCQGKGLLRIGVATVRGDCHARSIRSLAMTQGQVTVWGDCSLRRVLRDRQVSPSTK